jgi:hypothetical protein
VVLADGVPVCTVRVYCVLALPVSLVAVTVTGYVPSLRLPSGSAPSVGVSFARSMLQVQHRLRPHFRPAHAGLLHAILHHMPTRTLHHARSDGPSLL